MPGLFMAKPTAACCAKQAVDHVEVLDELTKNEVYRLKK